MNKSIYIGWDPREAAAFTVARHSALRHLSQPINVYGLVLDDLITKGLYTRPVEMRNRPPMLSGSPELAKDLPKIMWDIISDAPMSTQHANARFLVPHLVKSGWALFMDGDMLARQDLAQVFEDLDESKAVYCVHHDHKPMHHVKMDGQLQTFYARKNWSSFMLFNCDHEANKSLTVELINTLPGRDLHRFCWLDNSEIGELDPKWNFLVGHSEPTIDPAVVHFTSGTPDMPGYEDVPYADEWYVELNRSAA